MNEVSPPLPEADDLRDLVRRRVEQLARTARKEGDVPPDAIASVDRLARLADLEDRARPPRRRARWPLAATLLGTLLLVSLLLFARVAHTDVELELVLSDVGFVLSHSQAVTTLTNLAELRVSGVRGIQAVDPALSQLLGAPGRDETLRVAVATAADGQGSVTVEPVTFPAKADVRVSAVPGTESGIVLHGGDVTLRVTVFGPLSIGAGPNPIEISTPKGLSIHLAPDEATIDLRALHGTSVGLAPQVAIEGLRLFRIDEFASGAAAAQPVSTILSGTLYFEALNGRAHQLRPHELLRVDGILGVIRTLHLDADRIVMNVRGRVDGLRSGWSDEPADLMPTWLEWLQARHGLSLLWGTTLYVFGVVVAVLRWWRLDA